MHLITPADEIEQIVITHVHQTLKSPANCHKELSNISVGAIYFGQNSITLAN
ncbi:MAG: hypothetical protein U0X86_000913 [Wolbachia endosymbiont of Xenopsylla cheopis]